MGETKLISKISFSSKQKGELAGRNGEFTIGNKKLKTPKFFPIINIMTGPPGIFRTGGIWRGIKKELLGEEQIEAFMTQILHFLDYNISKKTLNDWFDKPLDERIMEEAKYKPIIFTDSGGFKLLYTEGIDTSTYGFSPTPEEILNMQLKFGADFLATLDYPIPPNLSIPEVVDRKQKSTRNAIRTLHLIQDKELSNEKFVFIPVHGYDFTSSYRYVQDTLKEIKQNNLSDVNFGLAIGSLVPLKSNYKKMIDIVAGVVQGLRDDDDFHWEDIPVHAFGVSGLMMPILAIMGIDTFDSSSFAQSANNLIYLPLFGTRGINFYDLKEEDIGRIKDCTETALGLRIRSTYVIQDEYLDISREIAESTDPEYSYSISVPIQELTRRTASRVLDEFAEYFELIRKSLRNIILDIHKYNMQDELLYRGSFWINFVTKVMNLSIENYLWDFKKTFQMWHTRGQEKEKAEFKFCENVASMANSNGGVLIVGVSNNIPRKIAGVDDLENKIQSIKLIINRHLNCNSDFIHLQPINIKDDVGANKICLIIAISQTKDVVSVKDNSGKISYPKRLETGSERMDYEAIKYSKINVLHDNHNYILTLNKMIHD